MWSMMSCDKCGFAIGVECGLVYAPVSDTYVLCLSQQVKQGTVCGRGGLGVEWGGCGPPPLLWLRTATDWTDAESGGGGGGGGWG